MKGPVSFDVCILGAPAEEVHHMEYHNLMEGRPGVVEARHKWSGSLATNVGHTSARKGCSQVRAVAVVQHNAAAVVEGSRTEHHIQVAPHSLHSHSLLPGLGPNTAAADIAAHRDPGRCTAAADIEAANSTGAVHVPGRSLHRCHILLDCQQQIPMAELLHVLEQLEHHYCTAANHL